MKLDGGAQLPNILNALECENNGITLVLEVTQHIGDNAKPLLLQSHVPCSLLIRGGGHPFKRFWITMNVRSIRSHFQNHENKIQIDLSR